MALDTEHNQRQICYRGLQLYRRRIERIYVVIEDEFPSRGSLDDWCGAGGKVVGGPHFIRCPEHAERSYVHVSESVKTIANQAGN